MNCSKAGLIAIFLLVLVPAGRADVVDFTFAIWSDTHFGAYQGGGFRDNAAQDIVNLPGTAYPAEIGGVVGPIEFVITPGDITENTLYSQYENGDGDSDNDFITCINRWFTPLGIPVYEITGNHDSYNEPGATQIRQAIIGRHGSTSYSVDYNGVHFIGLDAWTSGTEPFHSSALDYLENHMPTLTTEQAIIIFNHFTPSDPPHAQWDRVYNAIAGYNVIALCQGHEHYPRVGNWRGFDYLVTSDCKVNHANPGFSVVHITDTQLTGVAYNWSNNSWRTDALLQKPITGLGPWCVPEVVNPSFEDNGGSLDGWQVIRSDGEGPDNPPLDNTNSYGPRTPFGDHFSGKIASWGTMDFALGQLIEVADFNPIFSDVEWSLSTHVQLYCHSGADDFPENVHQVWEVGWNDDGSACATIDQCDNYSTVAEINANYTGNDDVNFYPLSANGTIGGVTGLHCVALRARIYNDAARQWSMSNIDNVSFQAIAIPPGPEIELDPLAIETTIWIRNLPANDLFTVTNGGPGVLDYNIEIEGDPDWLSVLPEAGSSTGEADPIEVIYAGNVADLEAGEYTATITVTAGEAWNDPQTVTVSLTVETVGPDFDGDADVDLKDFAFLQACFSGSGVPLRPGCEKASFDGDADVDRYDFDAFSDCLSGADVPADPECE